MSVWTLEEAVAVCRDVEAVCPAFGCHVALTGGTLYKDGARKDLDLLFYRIRQVETVNTAGLFEALAQIGIEQAGGFGWCFKAKLNGKPIDCFFPEEEGGEYEGEADRCAAPGCTNAAPDGLCLGCLAWVEAEAAVLASVDTHPKGEDAKQASALLSSAVAKPDAQPNP